MLGRSRQPERRRWKRQWFSGSVRLSCGSGRIDGLGITVSAGGMYFFAIADLAVGTPITIDFQPPHSREVVSVAGVVRHRAVYLYGVEFESPARESDTSTIATELS
jgi:hypothetical protein